MGQNSIFHPNWGSQNSLYVWVKSACIFFLQGLQVCKVLVEKGRTLGANFQSFYARDMCVFFLTRFVGWIFFSKFHNISMCLSSLEKKCKKEFHFFLLIKDINLWIVADKNKFFLKRRVHLLLFMVLQRCSMLS